MWKERFSLLAVVLSTLGGIVIPVRADDRITVLADTVQYQFGHQMVFHLEVISPAEITQVVLSYGPAGKGDTFKVQPADFKPGTRVLANHGHDLAGQRFQTSSELEYHWTVVDARGQRLTTTPVKFIYEDNRFDWGRLEADGLTVAWYNRPITFGRTALYVAQQARARIAENLRGAPQQPIRLYIYATANDLAGAAQLGGREWVAGQAYSKSGVSLIAIPEDQTSARELQRVIPHELSHLLVGMVSSNLPYWLDEGLATDNEELHAPSADPTLEAAVVQGKLLAFERLCKSFPADPQQAALAYAQSGSLVSFIRGRYGPDGLHKLLATYGDNPDCQAGVLTALGISLSNLQAEWEMSRPQHRDPFDLIRANGAWLALWLGSCLIVLLALPFVPLRRKNTVRNEQKQAGAKSSK